MTKQRALEILKSALIGGSLRYAFPGRYGSFNAPTYADGITSQEDMFIRLVWKAMPGGYSYRDALLRISKGNI